jgi:hypothetical protein
VSTNEGDKIDNGEGLVSKELDQCRGWGVGVGQKTSWVGRGRVVTANKCDLTGSQRADHNGGVVHELNEIGTSHAEGSVLSKNFESFHTNGLETVVLASLNLIGAEQQRTVSTTGSRGFAPCTSIVETESDGRTSKVVALSIGAGEKIYEVL